MKLDNTINICHINLANGFRGGERQAFLLIKKLSEFNFHQTVVVRHRSVFNERLHEIKGIKIISVKKPFLLNFWKLKNFDIIHTHEAKGKYLAYLAKKFFNTPYIITRRVIFTPSSNRFTRNTLINSSKVIALSTAIKNVLSGYNDRIRISVIPDAISSINFNPKNVTRLRNRFKNKFIIGNVGAMVENSKGHENIIEAAQYFKKINKDIIFLIVGGGKDENYFKEKAKSLNNVFFTGFVNNVADYLELFDIFIFPSLTEGLGSSILDAMMFDNAVVASNVGGIPDIIEDKVNGLLIEPDNTKDLCNKISLLYNDKMLRKTLASNAKQNLSKFNIQTITEQYINIYKTMLYTIKK